MRLNKGSAFTLIELLIVVAIIAILAAIAVPNFLEAQTRAKIARVQADLRTMEVGVQSYSVDERSFPVAYYPHASTELGLYGLTTPIAYLLTIPVDPFMSSGRIFGWQPPFDNDYVWTYYKRTSSSVDRTYGDAAAAASLGFPSVQTALLYSAGPGAVAPNLYHWFGTYLADGNKEAPTNEIYDASNGTASYGAIYRVMGDTRSFPNTNQ